jgi:L-ascorbate metabolism protein UlaG (beta-lactamase superfamily)
MCAFLERLTNLFEYNGLKISWLGHDGFKIKNTKTVYIDPVEIKPSEEADIILITHDHFDHCSPKDVEKIASAKTVVITTPAAKRQLSRTKAKEVRVAKPGEKILIGDVSIETVPSYNVNKFTSPGKVFHGKQEGMLGFIVTMKGVKVYHAGDSDYIPEMERFNVDIACLPVSGVYVMTAEEAAEAAKRIKPKIAIPMHYGVFREDDGSLLGKPQDAERFKKLAACEVRILPKE